MAATPVGLSVQDNFGTLPGLPVILHIDDRFTSEEWLYSVEREEVFTDGLIYSSILEPCPPPGIPIGTPCSFSVPQTKRSFYSHRVRRYIDKVDAWLCVVGTDLQLRLRIEARWRTTRKILDTNGVGYNTIPLASLGHNDTATESGTGITHAIFSDVFDKTITIPIDCPLPDFTFTPVSTTPVQTEISLGAREFAPFCCSDVFFFSEDLYTPLANSPVVFRFKKCDPLDLWFIDWLNGGVLNITNLIAELGV
jgi:hypothetical protein